MSLVDTWRWYKVVVGCGLLAGFVTWCIAGVYNYQEPSFPPESVTCYNDSGVAYYHKENVLSWRGAWWSAGGDLHVYARNTDGSKGAWIGSVPGSCIAEVMAEAESKH